MAAPKRNAKAGGRKAGVPNKVTRELKEIAQVYTEEAILIAAKIMRKEKAPESARLTAITIILERGHGKAPQAVKHSGAVAVGSYDLSKVPDDELERAYEILSRAATAPVRVPGGDNEAES